MKGLHHHLLVETTTSNPSPPLLASTATTSSSWDSRISPSILLIIAILAIIFFLSGLLHLLIRYLLTPSSAATHHDPYSPSAFDTTAMQGQLQQLFHLHDSGVDQSFIDALPVFLYRSLTKDPFDCAVCLCEFDPDDRLRLLPKCSHAFHLHCIDTWLLSHSTCPLCRRSLLPPDESDRYLDVDLRTPSDLGTLQNEATQDLDVPQPLPEEKLVNVKLGKYKATAGGEGSSGAVIDQRRCFSMGSFEYVLDETSQLKVAIQPAAEKKAEGNTDGNNRRRMAMSECDCHSQREFGTAKKESVSFSKTWLRGVAGRKERIPVVGTGGGDVGSRRVVSFRLGSEFDSGSEMGYDVESICEGSRSGAAVRRGEEAPSFARRTMLWVMGKSHQPNSKVGTTITNV